MLVTKDRLRNLAAQEERLRKATTASILHESTTETLKTYDVFLSHSSIDADLILGAKRLLEEYGFSVYVDWVDDPQLIRSRVNKTSAAVIRSRMKSSKILLYAHTYNSSNSRWCPWELGYFDGDKGGNVFILPIADRASDSFQGQEYLELYPYVDEALSQAGASKLWINYEDTSHDLTQARAKTFEAQYVK